MKDIEAIEIIHMLEKELTLSFAIKLVYIFCYYSDDYAYYIIEIIYDEEKPPFKYTLYDGSYDLTAFSQSLIRITRDLVNNIDYEDGVIL